LNFHYSASLNWLEAIELVIVPILIMRFDCWKHFSSLFFLVEQVFESGGRNGCQDSWL